MVRAVWLVPALPLAGALTIFAGGWRLRRWAGWIASAAVGASFVVSVIVLSGLFSQPNRLFVQHLWTWIPVGSFVANVDLRVDPLSITMALVVTGVSALIHVYSIGYMAGDARITRYFGQLNLFVFFMLLLVLANNFALLYVGWEGVGVASYLLIGHWFERPAAASAAKKAFIVTRIGDVALLLGIALIFARTGSLDFSHVFAKAPCFLQTSLLPCGVTRNTVTAIGLLILGGAVGKSAQIPLHTWLPDAMEGPTPVSALIHAATMVTAGVYLIVRTHVFFDLSSTASAAVIIVGVVTALYAAISALGQDDIKRTLAYSTISQIGFMFFAAGLHAYAAAIFLLVVHAFYKALLFLSTGSVIHALDGEQDMKRMGGLRTALPITFWTFVLGWLAIAGIPPLSGFFAKDQILAAASQSGRVLAWVVALIAAFFSALYMTRLAFLTFFGDRRGEKHPHESPSVMTAPAVLLAVAAVVGGILGLSATTGVIPRFLEPVVGGVHTGVHGPSEVVLTVVSVVVALAGIALGWFVYGSGRIDWVGLRARFGGVKRTMERGFYVDDVYGALLVTPGKAGAAFAAYVVDTRVIDGAATSLGRLVGLAASAGRRVQSGFVRTYALVFLLGVVAILSYLAVRS